MGQNEQMTVNRLPSPTWNWLHMNESSLSGIDTENRGACLKVEVPKGLTYCQKMRNMQAVSGGMGADMDRLLAISGVKAETIVAPKGIREEAPVLFHLSYDKDASGIHAVELAAEEDSSMTVIMDYTSAEHTGSAAVSTKMRAGRNAKIRLVQVQLLGDQFVHLNDVGADCEPGGCVEVLQLFLGAGKTYSGCLTELTGEESSVAVKVGYLGREEQRLDMNYVANHRGIRSKSRIQANGILKDEAFKLFRGTIDFKTGSSDSEGEETEDVLLLGDDVVNQTVPLILCGEENVQGNHGATIGKLDEEMLFYLCSRGMTKEDAVNRMARARIDAFNREIPSKEVQHMVQEYLKGVFGDGME